MPTNPTSLKPNHCSATCQEFEDSLRHRRTQPRATRASRSNKCVQGGIPRVAIRDIIETIQERGCLLVGYLAAKTSNLKDTATATRFVSVARTVPILDPGGVPSRNVWSITEKVRRKHDDT